MFIMLLSLISLGYYQPANDDVVGSGVSNVETIHTTSKKTAKANDALVDQKLAADIGATVAIQAKMPIAASVANLAVSLEAQKDMAQVDSSTVAKPQIIQLVAGDRSIDTYKVKRGDSVASIAAQFGLDANTIRWANNLSSDTLELGQELVILPVDGIIYTVKSDDSIKSIASRYKTTPERIVAYNDLEVKGLKSDTKIIVPGGILPTTERPGYEPPQPSNPFSSVVSGSGGSFTPSYSTSYPWGWCTYYAAARSGAPGNWGNANTWAYYAARTPGWNVSQRPVAGAIAQRGGGWGHVAIVDAVSADGTMIKYSDMNGLAGFGAVGHTGKWVPASSFQNYIYR